MAAAPQKELREDRFYLRITAREKDVIREAAELSYKDVTAFVRDAAIARAEEVIASHQATAVPSDFFDLLLKKLEEPPEVIPVLARAAERARKLGR